jgi:hypothetical protein
MRSIFIPDSDKISRKIDPTIPVAPIIAILILIILWTP